MHPAWRREDFLGTFAPFTIVMLMIVWVVTLIFGFGLILHALQDDVQPRIADYPTAFYLAGTSLLTIGFGDFVPVGVTARFFALLAGASGLAVVALVISLMFNLYGSFARREVMVLLLDARAGVPPSGVMLLESFGRWGIVEDLAPTFARFESWTAEMLDSHLAYPILPFFRSSHDGQSWVGALGAVLDAATLLMTVARRESLDAMPGLRQSVANAEMMYVTGCHALVDLTQVRVKALGIRLDTTRPGIERAEFEAACQQLIEVGYDVDCGEETWRAFAERRSVYAERLNLLAQFFASPPTLWIGDRTVLHVRQLLPHFET
jgi:Ion channel